MANTSKHPSTTTGAMREALSTPYFRQVPLEAIAAGCLSLEYGAQKYTDRNWEKGLPWQQLIDSLRRHLDDFERGHDIDDGPNGSNLPHICNIMANAMMLSASVIRGIGDDNRLPPPPETALSAKQCAQWMAQYLNNQYTNQEEEAGQ